MAKIKLMTDSTSDLPKEYIQKYNIAVLPLTIIDGEKEYLDGVDLDAKDFYTLLETSEKLPSTSRVSQGLFIKEYEKAYNEGYTDLIYVALNSKGSSTYHGANMEMEDFYDEHPEAKDKFKIHTIDSLTYSMGYGYSLIEGAKAVEEGKETDEVISIIKNWLDNVRVLFIPLDLRFVKKSGRVSAAAAFVGDALGLKPIITFEDGESKILSKVRGEKKAISEVLNICESEIDKDASYILAYGSNEDAFNYFKEEALKRFSSPSMCFPLGSVIAINSGHNVLGIIYKKK